MIALWVPTPIRVPSRRHRRTRPQPIERFIPSDSTSRRIQSSVGSATTMRTVLSRLVPPGPCPIAIPSAIGMMSATKPCDAGDPIGQPGTRTHIAARPSSTSSGSSGTRNRSIRSTNDPVVTCCHGSTNGSPASGGETSGISPHQCTSPAGRSVCAVVACSTVRPSTVPSTWVWLVARAWTTTSTASSRTSPGCAFFTYWVVIHTSGRPVTASAATAQAATPLPP